MPGDLAFADFERPGTYEVIVQTKGYCDWRQTNVVVPMDAAGCHVVTEMLQAKLQRK